MGEIIFSLIIGGLLVVSGIFMIVYLKHEEKSLSEDEGVNK